MKSDQLNCKTNLREGIISQEVFNRELALCAKLNKEKNGKCGWGKCQDCGVIPLLYKLRKSELLENPAEIKKLKDKIFG